MSFIEGSKHLIFDCVKYSLNDKDKTASIIGLVSGLGKLILIPRSISYKNQEYIIKSISSEAFKEQIGIKSVEFASDSEIQKIEKDAFLCCSIDSFSIPSSVIELEEGWCNKLNVEAKVTVDPKNPRYLSIDDQIIVGKSNIKNENYDSFVFAYHNIETINLPKTIKIIESYSCYDCIKLQVIEIPEDSELEIIGTDAFYNSQITRLTIPSKVIELKEGWCNGTLSLLLVTVDSNNPRYLSIDDQIIIGKSNIKNENYDSLVFVNRNIETINLPKTIKIIESYSCCNCNCLYAIEIPEDSELEIIGTNAFYNSSITRLTIPSNFVEFKEGWNNNLYELKSISVNPNNRRYMSIDDKMIIGKSDIENINYDVFVYACIDIQTIKLPKTIKTIKSHSMYYCDQLETIEIPEDSELEVILKGAFDLWKIKCLRIPSSVIDLKDGWCMGAHSLEKIVVDSNNPRYSSIDDKIIIGKSDINNKDYDVLVFACKMIKSINLPKTIKIIKSNVFKECNQFEKIEIPEDSELEIIEEHAFNLCVLKRISLPRSLKIISKFAFLGSHVEQIDFPSKSELHTIGERAFSCSRLHQFFIPPNVTKIDNYAFDMCFYLQKIDIPNDSKLQEIDLYAFNESSIESITIPLQLKIIREGAFSNCKKLQKFEIPTNSELQIIEKNVFCNNSIEYLKIPSSVIELKKGWCDGLCKLNKIAVDPKNRRYKSINDKMIIGKSNIENINYDVFVYACRDIQTIKLPKTIKIIESYSISQCNQLETIEIPEDSKLEVIEKNAFSESAITSIKIPIHLKFINEEAFAKCKKLQKIEIPPNSELQIIGKNAFSESIIEEIKIPPQLTTIDQCAFYKCQELTKVEIPSNSNLQIIGKSAFNNSSINTIYIPRHVKVIDTSVFGNCNFMYTVEIPNDSELETIKKFSFPFSGIGSLRIPSSVTEIESGWCVNVEKLKNVIVDSKNPRYLSINDEMIIGKSNINNDSYDTFVFAGRDIKEIVIPDEIKIIESNAFEFPLKKVIFTENSKLEIIKNNAFCFSLIQFLSIPKHLKVIGPNAFDGCKNLNKIEIPFNSELQIIDDQAFYNIGITCFSIPPQLTTIGKLAFSKCYHLKRFDIPDDSKLRRIGEEAFYDCPITCLFIPPHLTLIHPGAFCGCDILILEISENYELMFMDKNIFFELSNDNIIMVPMKLRNIFNSNI